MAKDAAKSKKVFEIIVGGATLSVVGSISCKRKKQKKKNKCACAFSHHVQAWQTCQSECHAALKTVEKSSSVMTMPVRESEEGF
jgi:hypothetical protein